MINPQHQDLYRQFDKNLGLLEGIMERESEEVVGERGNLSTGRIAVLFTAEQMQRLTEWLQAIREIEEGDVRGELERLLQPLPQTVPGRVV